jgi:hypothetical protein
MKNFKKIANEISKCRAQGNAKGRGFPKNLRKRICSAAEKYGRARVAREVGIDQCLIGRWFKDTSIRHRKNHLFRKKNRPIVFQELPTPIKNFIPRPAIEGVFLQLTSPSGFTISLNTHPGSEETANIIKAFMGGQS